MAGQNTVGKMQSLLASWVVFYQKTRTYHWDLLGSNFLELHKMFKKMYEASVENADTIAERNILLQETGRTLKLEI